MSSQSAAIASRIAFPLWCATAGLLLFSPHPRSVAAETSALWGEHGERWGPHSRLPDFSFAGYHCGETPIPTVPVVANVRTLGAKGDGVTDDTQAFLSALASAKHGAVFVPPGRYCITQILEINRPGVVLRGAGPDKTVLFFPKTLNDIKPDWGKTTGGQRTSNYSWSGGFVWFKGWLGQKKLTDIVAPSVRGDSAVTVSSAEGLQPGQRITISETDDPDNSLATELYSGEPGKTQKLLGRTKATLVCKITRIEGARVFFDRPLRCTIEPKWKPEIQSYRPTVTESGIEDLAFEFPNTPYQGHFTELGRNAIAFSGVADCWARNIRILNSDSGIHAGGYFCTIQRVVLQSHRKPDKLHSTGHHGISLNGQDNLLTDFDFQTEFIHDLTVDGGAAGNVSANGKGVDLCFDHHKRACYENLFTDIDVGAGSHVWRHGGGDALGNPCAARGTFWNLRSRQPLSDPPAGFGPLSMNLVAVQTDQSSETTETGRWREVIAPANIQPVDIHAAQLSHRMKNRAPGL